jgi:2-isopropylmalate synthase
LPDETDLIHDWNGSELPSGTRVEFDDETLRDGLQSPSVTIPSLEEKLEILHLMNDLGIHTADIGLPAAGPWAKDAVRSLAKEIRDSKLAIRANCAARTVIGDVQPILDVSQEIGIPIEACVFIGSSEIRRYAEDWDVDRMQKHTEDAVRFCVEHDLPVMYVTEDTVRAKPETVKRLYTAAIRAGAPRVCVCDTVGHATPAGAFNLVTFVKNEVIRPLGVDVKIDWHGHRDRGLDLPNAIAAIKAGASRVHGTALGIGERCGNLPMDLLLVNLKLMGVISNDLRQLPEYCRKVSEYCRVPIPRNYPAVGSDAFETATGVHAAAVIKALKKGDRWLADRVYSGVPAAELGLSQKIGVGPMSGRSNVVYWLESHGHEPEERLVTRLFDLAKTTNRVLTDSELEAAVAAHRAG